MVSKAETAEIRDILSPPVEDVEKTKEVTDETTDVIEEETQTDEEVAALEGDVEDTAGVSDDVAASDDTTGDKTYTPSELAEAIDWELDDVYNGIVIPLDGDGGESIPLGEFKNKYQDMAREVTQLQTQLTEATTGLEKAQTGVTQTQQLSDAMVEQVGYLNQINAAEQNTDWAELEELDPTDAILKRDKIRRARDEVQGKIVELQQQEQAQTQEFMQAQHTKMLELIPEWKDAAVKEKDETGMLETMRGYGFQDAETKSIIDPRQMKLLKRLSYLEAKEKQSSAAVRKVRSAPRKVKGRAVEPASNVDKVEGMIAKAKKTGDKRDAHKAISALLNQAQG